MEKCNLCQKRIDIKTDKYREKNGYSLFRCQTCGLIFVYPLPLQEQLKEIYSDQYFFGSNSAENYIDYLADKDLHIKNANEKIKKIQEFLLNGKILDVGCAAGFFVKQAQLNGFQAEGIDISNFMCDWGQKSLEVKLVNDIFLYRDFGQNFFDCLTMFDYIEHSIDPMSELLKAHKLLRKSGILVLSTGDISSIFAKISGSRWHLLTPKHHNFYFSPKTISEYLKRAGFFVTKIEYNASRYTTLYLVHKLRTLFFERFFEKIEKNLLNTKIADFGLPVNLWDIMTVYAIKK